MVQLRSLLAHLLLVPFAAAAPIDIGKTLEDIANSLPEDAIDKIGNKGIGILSSFLRPMISNADAQNIIPNRYIVVYNNTYEDDLIDAKEASFVATIKKRNLNKRSSVGHILSTEVNSFHLNKWRAMALDADDLMVQDIWNSPEVAYIEADTHVQLSGAIAQINAPEGVNRLSHSQPNDNTYIFDESAGEGITAYVVDTGIRITHTEFEGRATFGANFINNNVCSPLLRKRTVFSNL